MKYYVGANSLVQRRSYGLVLTFICAIVEPLLVDNGINSNGGLSRLSVSNDQLSLATPNGNQAVHSLDPSLHGLPDGDARDDAGGFHADTSTLIRHYRTLSRNERHQFREQVISVALLRTLTTLAIM